MRRVDRIGPALPLGDAPLEVVALCRRCHAQLSAEEASDDGLCIECRASAAAPRVDRFDAPPGAE